MRYHSQPVSVLRRESHEEHSQPVSVLRRESHEEHSQRESGNCQCTEMGES